MTITSLRYVARLSRPTRTSLNDFAAVSRESPSEIMPPTPEEQSSSPSTSERTDGGEGGENKGDQRPVGFWHSELKNARRDVAKHWVFTSRYIYTKPMPTY